MSNYPPGVTDDDPHFNLPSGEPPSGDYRFGREEEDEPEEGSPRAVIEAAGCEYLGLQQRGAGKEPGHMFNAPGGSTLMMIEAISPESLRAHLSDHFAKIGACHICGKKASESRSGDCFLVRDCKICDLPACQEHVEADYEEVGDPPGYRLCQWSCFQCLERKVTK